MFSELVVAYLFLGGTGAGVCAVMAVLGLLSDGDEVRRSSALRFRDGRGCLYGSFFGTSLIGAAAVLGLAALCLVADVGRPDRVLVLATSAPTSYLVIGAWAVALCFALAFGAALLWRGLLPATLSVLRIASGLLLVVAVVVFPTRGYFFRIWPRCPCGTADGCLSSLCSRVFRVALRCVLRSRCWEEPRTPSGACCACFCALTVCSSCSRARCWRCGCCRYGPLCRPTARSRPPTKRRRPR